MKKLLLIFAILLLTQPVSAQNPPEKPFILPVGVPPSLETWFMGQPYGNTTGAYNFGVQWYSAGQRLHFGIDLFMPCGTPLVAMADGEVHAVDAGSFGSAPHNLILRHPQLGYTVLYGHLLETPTLVPGQPVRQGDVVGLSGDPDGECLSRPHLHLEVRASDFRSTVNPIALIDANWNALAMIGPFAHPMFQRDLDNPRRWVSLDDQPNVLFGGAPLNNYVSTWPYPVDVRPPASPPLSRDLALLPPNSEWSLRQIGQGGCCYDAWWHPEDSNRVYVIDGVAGQRANVFEYTLDGSAAPAIVEPAPPMLLSPDWAYQVTRVNGQVTIRDLSDLREWTIDSQGALPSVSTNNDYLLWEVFRGGYLPGEPLPTIENWVSRLDGSEARLFLEQAGGEVVWLDGTRALIIAEALDEPHTTLSIYDAATERTFLLGRWNWMRGLTVSPGGQRLMFYVNWQADPAANGIYSIETQQGATAQQMPWFGAWRWRSNDEVYYIPFDVNAAAQTLGYYNLTTGEDRYLTDANALPFNIANGDWAVSPDGNRIAFQNANDMNLWVLETTP